jgi:hypothetical protein
MTLIDLYVAEVAKRLPLRGRSDIQAELRSTLEDMLEDRSRKAGRPVDEETVKALLRGYGPPDKVAATYQPTPHLIGPRIYPFFLLVLKIVFSALTVVLLIGLGIQLASQSMQGLELAKAIGSGLLGILNAAILAFGNIVLVFAILERVLPASEFTVDEEKKEWDPASLVKVAEPVEVKPWEPIAAIVFTVAALIIFNAYPHLIGISFLRNGEWTSIPALTAAFFRWLPYINVLWALEIALNIVLLRRGRWQAGTKWSSIALNAAGIVIGYFLLSGPAIVSLSPAALQATGLFDAQAAAVLSAAAGQGARVIIIIVIIVEGAEVVRDVVKQILKRR